MAEDRPPTPAGLHSNALLLADAARLLTSAGSQPVSVAMLQADLDAGTPRNADGTLNLVHYAAWLVQKEMNRAD